MGKFRRKLWSLKERLTWQTFDFRPITFRYMIIVVLNVIIKIKFLFYNRRMINVWHSRIEVMLKLQLYQNVENEGRQQQQEIPPDQLHFHKGFLGTK